MTRKDQIKFTKDLCGSIAGDIVAAVKDGRVPETWDGHELRCLIAEKAADAATRTQIRTDPRSKRARDFKNTLATTNL